MKMRSIYAAGAAALLALGLAACGDSDDEATPTDTIDVETAEPDTEAPEETEEHSEDVPRDGAGELTEEAGLLVDTDVEADILEEAGVAVTIDTEAQLVQFELLDPDTGESYTNTYEFDFESGEFRHHKYVSAMGATFDYTMDMETNEIKSIIDSSGEEGIDAVREQGRFEIAQADRDTEREEIETYFEDRYGMTVEEAAMDMAA